MKMKLLVVATIAMASSGVLASSLFIDPAGNVGVGTEAPTQILHTYRNDAAVAYPQLFFAENAAGPNALFRFQTTSTIASIDFNKIGDEFRLNMNDGDGPELRLTPDGDLIIQGQLTTGSSRETKERIYTVNYDEVLDKVQNLPIAEWSYIGQQSRHMGPMAEDFAAAFGLGENSRGIAPADMAGVALGAVKALQAQLQSKDAEIAELKADMAQLEGRLAHQEVALQKRIGQVEEMMKVMATVVVQPQVQKANYSK